MLNGQLKCAVGSSGELLLTPRPSDGIPSSYRERPGRHGWAIDSQGYGYFEPAPSTIPATAYRYRGIAFTQDGAIYITDTAPSSSAIRFMGLAVRADGALHVNSGAATSELRDDGVAVDSDNRVHVGGAVFHIGFADSGSGAVDTAVSLGGVSATFTRATTATTVDSAGLIVSVSSGVPRSYYSPSGTYLGYLAEGARTNKCQRSEDFANVWTDVGTPTSAAGSTLGALTLTTLGDDSAAALEGKIQTVSFTGNAVKAISVFVKKGTSTSTAIRLRDTSAPADRLLAVVTWSGTVPVVTMTTGTDLTGTPEQYGTSGVYRLSFATSSVTATNTNSLQIYPATDAALAVGGTGTIEVGGVQAEDATFQSSYIPTPASATVTRNADVLSYPITGWFNASEGTILANATCLAEDPSNFNLFTFSAATYGAGDGLLLRVTSDTSVQVGGNSSATSVTGVYGGGVSVKAAAAYRVADTAMIPAANGALGAQDATMDFTGTGTIRANIGSLQGDNTQHHFGTISSITAFGSRRPNDILQELT